MRTEGTRTPDS